MNDKESMEKLSNTLVDVETVAGIFDVSIPTVYVWIKRGTIESVEIKHPSSKRGTLRVKSSSVRKLLGIDDQIPA